MTGVLPRAFRGTFPDHLFQRRHPTCAPHRRFTKSNLCGNCRDLTDQGHGGGLKLRTKTLLSVFVCSPNLWCGVLFENIGPTYREMILPLSLSCFNKTGRFPLTFGWVLTSGTAWEPGAGVRLVCPTYIIKHQPLLSWV